MVISRIFLWVAALSIAAMAFAEPQDPDHIPTYAEVAKGNFLGDYGYEHWPNHGDYQATFGDKHKCACGTGDCRVTDWRETQLGSPTGYDILVDREWVAVPADTFMPLPNEVPRGLLLRRAHVCAYVDSTTRMLKIPCALIIKTQT